MPIGASRVSRNGNLGGAVPDSAILNIKASDYDSTNNKYAATIGPDVPDVGGDPTQTTDTVAGNSNTAVVDYSRSADGDDDYSQTTNIATSSDVIGIVWTGKVKTANDNGFPIDGSGTGNALDFLMNDDDSADGWRLFRGGSQAVSNSGSVTTDYATYSLIGKNNNEIGLKVNNNLVAGFSAGSSSQIGAITVGARVDGSTADSGQRTVELSVLDDTTVPEIDTEAARQGSLYGTF